MKTFKITPKPKKLDSFKTAEDQGCPGYDVDASEDGCSIVLCDCTICSTNKTEQLQFLVDEISHVEKNCSFYHRII